MSTFFITLYVCAFVKVNPCVLNRKAAWNLSFEMVVWELELLHLWSLTIWNGATCQTLSQVSCNPNVFVIY